KEAAAGSKNLIGARKESADAAKKEADDAKKHADELRKAYEALRDVSPTLAEQFKTSMGGVAEATSKVGTALVPFKKQVGETFLQAAKDAEVLADAYKALGVTSSAALATGADKVDEAFRKVAAAVDG